MPEMIAREVWAFHGTNPDIDEAMKEATSSANCFLRDIVQEGEEVLSVQPQLIKDGANYIYLLTVVHTRRFKVK